MVNSSETEERSSPEVEQQAHPFWSSTNPAGWADDDDDDAEEVSLLSLAISPRTSLESMLTLATSFTITAIFNPSLLASRCCKQVVFPLPKNPLKTVMGTTLPLLL